MAVGGATTYRFIRNSVRSPGMPSSLATVFATNDQRQPCRALSLSSHQQSVNVSSPPPPPPLSLHSFTRRAI